MPTFMLTLFIVICILLIVVVLLQKGRGGGLSGAFGGGMTSSAFGTRTGDVFTWVTIVLTGLFLLLAIGNTLLHRPKETIYYPMFDPSSGPISSETGVTITVAPTPKTPDELTIRYTTNGDEPTETSEEYFKEAVRVKPGQTLSARVYRRGRAMPAISVTYNRPEAPAPTTGASTAPSAGVPAPASATAPSSGGVAPADSPAAASAPATERPATAATTAP
jgi:preprotein translocase subunit SecG